MTRTLYCAKELANGKLCGLCQTAFEEHSDLGPLC